MKAVISCFLLLAALLLSGQAIAQVIDSPPVFKVGDTWTSVITYNKRRGWPIAERATSVRVIEEVGEFIKYASTNSLAGVDTTSGGVFTLSLHVVSVGNQKNYPPSANYRWPLKPGDTWSNKFDWEAPSFKAKTDRTVKVVGWETITTPAGTFNAMKVEQAGRYTHYVDGGKSNSTSLTYWYAPEVKGPVKMVILTYGYEGVVWDDYTVELQSFKVR